jgi:hypothetical protein
MGGESRRRAQGGHAWSEHGAVTCLLRSCAYVMEDISCYQAAANAFACLFVVAAGNEELRTRNMLLTTRGNSMFLPVLSD